WRIAAPGGGDTGLRVNPHRYILHLTVCVEASDHHVGLAILIMINPGDIDVAVRRRRDRRLGRVSVFHRYTNRRIDSRHRSGHGRSTCSMRATRNAQQDEYE